MSEENKETKDANAEPSDPRAAEIQESREDIKLDPKLEVSQEDVSSNVASTDRDPESTAKEASPAAPAETAPADAEAKEKAIAEARAARAAAREKKEQEDAAEASAAPKEPSPNQPRLDRILQIIKENINTDAVEDSSINERDHDLPTITIRNSDWFACSQLLKSHVELNLNYLRNVSGVDQETHLEVVYYLLSLSSKHEYCIKVKTDREAASIASVTPVWQTANWNEREIYDLLGIDFPGHPDLRRIMMPDDWVGYPLRKDYESIDPEV
ncbi:MAG TPA: NADH-quinone oxidoreductase subunit C [Bacilli bacterium]